MPFLCSLVKGEKSCLAKNIVGGSHYKHNFLLQYILHNHLVTLLFNQNHFSQFVLSIFFFEDYLEKTQRKLFATLDFTKLQIAFWSFKTNDIILYSCY